MMPCWFLRVTLKVIHRLQNADGRLMVVVFCYPTDNQIRIISLRKANAGGRGYQSLINETLRRGLLADSVKEALREVLGEEKST